MSDAHSSAAGTLLAVSNPIVSTLYGEHAVVGRERSFHMPYERLSDLPDSVRENLPDHAQEIYRAAFNSAWQQYDTPEERRSGRSREETAHAVAWSAVEQKYQKDPQSGRWVEK
jgi:cation transport regulator